MKHISKFAAVVFSAAVLLTGCKGKDGDPGPAGATGQVLTSNITGFVNPVDENGAPLTKAGVVVALDGLNPAVTATSDADGRFTLSSVRSGTYNLTFSRQGYGTFRRFSVGHVGGDQPTFLGTTTISQPSTQTIPVFAAGTPSTGTAAFNMNFVSQTSTSSFRYVLFASTSPNPTAATGVLLQNGSVTFTTATTTLQFTLSVNRAQFISAGFASGTPVYVVAYGSTSITGAYIDVITGRTVFPNLNSQASPVAAVVVP